MSVEKAKSTLKYISGFSVDEHTGICHVEYTDRPECYKPMYECVDIFLAIKILHKFAHDEYIRLCRSET